MDKALADAAVVGNQPVGKVTADITTRVQRRLVRQRPLRRWHPRRPQLESTLGNLVADSLRDALKAPERGAAEIGVVNPGGLRDDLLYAGDTRNPQPDGIITYAEANAVLPFVNNIWTASLTGAQFKTVLEQQWQTNPGASRRAVPAPRPLRQRADHPGPDPARGSRMTSVTIDGRRSTRTGPTPSRRSRSWAPAATTSPPSRTGPPRTPAWWTVTCGSPTSPTPPASPDFVRQQVYQSGMPDTVYAGEHVAFTLDKLNLSSLGSPENTAVEMSALDATSQQSLGTVPVTGGTAAVALDVPASFAGGGTLTLTAQPSGTTVEIPIAAKDTPVVKIKKSPQGRAPQRHPRGAGRLGRRTGGDSCRLGEKIMVDGKLFKTKSLSDGALRHGEAPSSRPPASTR